MSPRTRIFRRVRMEDLELEDSNGWHPASQYFSLYSSGHGVETLVTRDEEVSLSDAICRHARSIAHRYQSLETLVTAVNEALGTTLDSEALRHRYRRWRAGTTEPALGVLLGRGPSSDFQDEPTVPTGRGELAEVVEDEPKRAPVPEPFIVPKESLAKKIPVPPELIVPWDWSQDPPALTWVETDSHFPLHDKRAEAAKLAFMADIRPDAYCHLGDFFDMTNLSRFDHDPQYAHSLQEEFDSARDHWSAVLQYTKTQHLIMGNHEWRLERAIMANHALFGLRCLEDWHVMAGIPEQVNVHPYGSNLQIGSAWMEHGDQVRGTNQSFWASHHRGGRCCLWGHSHRPGFYGKSGRLEDGRIGRREFWNLGHGQDARTASKWAGTTTGWVSSFALVAQFKDKDGCWDFRVTPVVSEGGVVVHPVTGKAYRG